MIYSGDAIGPQPTGTIVERRLTPQGLDLVSSGLLDPRNLLERPERPLGGTGVGSTVVWADQMNPYVPPRYAVCYADEETGIVDPSSVVGLLPERAEALLRGKERTYHHTAGLGGYIPSATCFELTIDEARMLDDTLRRADFERGTWRGGTFSWSQPDLAGKRIWIVFAPLLPQGEWVEW